MKRQASVVGWLGLLFLVDCGSKGDLVIGEVLPFAEAGKPSVGGSAGDGVGGSLLAGTSGESAGGSSASGNTSSAGAAGDGADDDCSTAEQMLPIGSLVHRYSFDGAGDVASDSISGADGDLVGTTLDGSGSVTMDGESRQYVDLPNGIVSSLSSLTVVTWMTWSSGAAYQRLFDFGITSSGEGLGDSGRSYVAVMPMTGFEDQAKPGLGAEIKSPGFPTVTLASTEDMEHRYAQVVLVFEGGVRASLYVDGTLLATEPTLITLADIEDVNNWIGQSQYQGNPFFQGSFEEFRIYDAALTACQIHALLVRGSEFL